MAALAGLLLLGAILLGGAVDSGGGRGTGTDPADVDYSSYNTGPYGLKGIYALMEARGTDVTRWRRAPAHLGYEIDRLVIWQPWAMATEDWEDLTWWVEDGGTLVISVGQGRAVSGILPEWDTHWIPTLAYADSPEVKPAGLSPIMEGVRALFAPESIGLQNLPPGATVYAANAAGHPVVIGWPLYDGQVYFVSDPDILANGWILEADNATLAVNLLEPGPGGRLAFDEYNHGVEAAQDWWQTLRPQMRWSMLQATLAALALLVLAGARLGRPVEAPEGISPDAVEFAHGLAALLRESRANRWVLERLYRSFLRDLARHLGASPRVGHSELGRLWQTHTGEPGAPLADLLDRSAAPLEPRDKELLQILRQMGEFRRRIRGA